MFFSGADPVLAPAQPVPPGTLVFEEDRGEIAQRKLTSRRRLVSLDAFRGFTMFWIVGGASLLRALHTWLDLPATGFLTYQMEHTPWHGLRYYDIIWPSFMLMVGVSVAFSCASRSGSQSWGQMRVHALRRAGVLFLLGSVRTSVSSGTATLIELSSALQPIAVAYLVAFLLARKTRRIQAAAMAGTLLGYGLLLHFVSAPGATAGNYSRDFNLVTWFDLFTLGRTHPEGWGTVLSTIPTVATTLLGLLIGGLLLDSRPMAAKMKIIGVTGLCGVGLGWALDPFVPVVMKLWTVSYGVLTAGWSCLLFLFFLWLIDEKGYRRWSLLFVVVGVNAIAAYMAGTLIPFSRVIQPFARALAGEGEPLYSVLRALGVSSLTWLALYWLYRRRIFIKI